MDIIVTTPKSQMRAAAQEAADCIAAGGGMYFRRFAIRQAPTIVAGDRVYYVEDGFVRGFAVVSNTMFVSEGKTCDTTGRKWPPGFYVYMDATNWRWIKPIPMKGFQGFRYAGRPPGKSVIWVHDKWCDVQIVGDWRDPKPKARA